MTWQPQPPDFRRFELSAAIDWIEVRVRLAGPSQPRHVRDRMAQHLSHWGTQPYVRPESDDPSGTATSFRLKVQNPTGPRDFIRDMQHLARPGDPPITDADIEIVSIEIALDAYSLAKDREELLRMATHFVRMHAVVPSVEAKLTSKGRPERIAGWGAHGIYFELSHGWTINAGTKDEPGAPDYGSRYYLKTYDTTPAGAYTTLPVSRHRARMEVVLRGERLPFRSAGEWLDFEFAQLAHMFYLRRFAPKNEMSGLLLQRLTRVGRPDDPVARDQKRRQGIVGTRKDSVANRLILNAMEKLTGYQSGKQPRRRRRA